MILLNQSGASKIIWWIVVIVVIMPRYIFQIAIRLTAVCFIIIETNTSRKSGIWSWARSKGPSLWRTAGSFLSGSYELIVALEITCSKTILAWKRSSRHSPSALPYPNPLGCFSSLPKPLPSLNTRWRSLHQNALARQNSPALRATNGSNDTLTIVSYAINLGAVVRFQTRTKDQLWQRFCLHWPSECRPSHEILWSAELAPGKQFQVINWLLSEWVNFFLPQLTAITIFSYAIGMLKITENEKIIISQV